MTAEPFPIRNRETLLEAPRFWVERVYEEGLDGTVRPREIIRHPGAAVVLPILPNGDVVLVEQHRTSIGGPLLEIPAGVLDPGESPRVAAERELREETGYSAGHWQEIQRFYPAPGILDELMHLYLATDLRAGAPDPDADEWVEVKTLSPGEVLERLSGEHPSAFRDGKTLFALSYAFVAGHLERP